MRIVTIPPEFEAWREVAREHLRAGWTPEQLDLQDASSAESLSLGLDSEERPLGMPAASPHVPKAFLQSAEMVAVHGAPSRWNLLYRVLYRLQANRRLMLMELDDDVAEMRRMEQQVRRDLHKMHAFVRFRKITVPDEEEHYVAWYRPDHRIVRVAAPFF